MQESPGLKPDWYLDIKLFSMKNSNILSYNNLSQILPAIGSNNIGQLLFNICLPPFLWTGTTFAFFHSVVNFPLFKQDWNINFRGLQIEVSYILIIQILIISCPLALFRSTFLIILTISSIKKIIIDRNSRVFFFFFSFFLFFCQSHRKFTVICYNKNIGQQRN